MLILVPTTLEIAGMFPELAPAASAAPARWLSRSSMGEPVDVARCGFGLSAAGARAAALLARRSDSACLAGLAGTLAPETVAVGTLLVAEAVEVDGIGFGSGAAFVHPAEASAPLRREWESQAPAAPWVPPVPAHRAAVLSVAAASASSEDAARRRARHPACVAEEMEADAVLHAAVATGRRVAVLRAVSNVAGDRDPAAWRTREALALLRETLDAWLRP